MVKLLLALVVAMADTTVITVPLDNGRLHVRDLVEAVFQEAGLDPGERFDGIDVTVDVGSALGKLKLHLVDQMLPGVMSTEVRADELIVTIDHEALRERRRQIVDGFASPEPDPKRFGCTLINEATADEAVVLVHGLDDPGVMWNDLIPRLTDVTVYRFEYPNDQPISESADLLAECLVELNGRRVSIVAHSMGGLVARDVLTRRLHYDGDGSGGDGLPAVDRLIMLGTPNHGAPMARMRGLAEVREVLVRWARGENGLLDSMADGAGEAGRDLLPDSDFIRRLNRRPLPSHTRITIVAGRAAPFSEGEVAEALSGWPRGSGRSEGAMDRVAGWLQAAVKGLGDGVVSLDSARLEGVDDFEVVEANHLSMILDPGNGDDAPAIPIVLDRLGILGE